MNRLCSGTVLLGLAVAFTAALTACGRNNDRECNEGETTWNESKGARA